MTHNPWKTDSEEFQLYETAYWKLKDGFKRKIKFLNPYLKEHGLFAPKGDLKSFEDFFNWLNDRDNSIVLEKVYDRNGEEIGVSEVRESHLKYWDKFDLMSGGYLMLPKTDINELDILDWIIERANGIKNKLSLYNNQPTHEQVKKLENLPHSLCLLDDLGILDLIVDKFSDKHYNGKARETDKSKLLSTILGIEDAENIRASLRKKDYTSDKAKKNVAKTLKSFGLEPSKFID